jgi:hypothetical protein
VTDDERLLKVVQDALERQRRSHPAGASFLPLIEGMSRLYQVVPSFTRPEEFLAAWAGCFGDAPGILLRIRLLPLLERIASARRRESAPRGNASDRGAEVLRQVSALQNAAMMAVYDGLSHLAPDPSSDRSKTAAAATVNWLFGKEPHPDHEGIAPAAREAAMRLLSNDGSLRRLVVQSLRMSATMEFMKTGATALSENEVLATFGRDTPDAPDPESFRVLVLGYRHPAGKKSAAEYFAPT